MLAAFQTFSVVQWLSEKRSDIQTSLSTTPYAANPYSGTLL
jgi:hypothetical protein